MIVIPVFLNQMLAWLTAMSMLALITLALPAQAHEVRPAVLDIQVGAAEVEVEVKLTAETLLAGIDLRGIADTNDAPEAELYDSLRALPEADLTKRFTDAWPELSNGFRIEAGEAPVALDLQSVEVRPARNLDVPRDTVITFTGALPDDGSPVRIGWAAENGPLIVRQTGGGADAYTGFLGDGSLSDPLPRGAIATESAGPVFLRYIGVGFDHIIPKGLDHILFVLGLFFLSLRMGALITQITVFTLAHTITLALASLGWVNLPGAIVEPLIAASIVYVAVENILTSEVKWWRPIVIFGFGLLHGLGFASVLGEFGLASGFFIAGLIGFNIGVEIGQLTVVLLAFLAVGYWFGKKPWYRARISIPASLLIAAIGAYWTLERTIL